MSKKKQIAVVTGGARRIGAQICRRLHQANIDLVIHYRNSSLEAKALQKELNNIRKGSAAIVKADLLNLDSYALIINKAIKIYGQLNFLINNASSYYATKINEVNETNWNDLINSNLKGALFLSKEAAPFLKKTNGSIINITDAHITSPKKNYIIYSVAKSGLNSLTKSLAEELGPKIRVNAIAPGEIETSMITPGSKKMLTEKIPMKRFGTPEEVAGVIHSMCSDTFSYVNGTEIQINGGQTV